MNKETELALKLLAAATDRLIRLCNLEESKVPTVKGDIQAIKERLGVVL